MTRAEHSARYRATSTLRIAIRPFTTSLRSNSLRTTMRPIRRGAARLRVLSLSALAVVFIFYTLLPDGAFRSGTGTGVQVQYPFKRKGVVAGDPDKAAAVKAAMNRTFWTYRAAAWGSDEVRPITGGNRTTRNNWAATVVDTLTTTLMVGLEEEFLLVRGLPSVAGIGEAVRGKGGLTACADRSWILPSTVWISRARVTW